MCAQLLIRKKKKKEEVIVTACQVNSTYEVCLLVHKLANLKKTSDVLSQICKNDLNCKKVKLI